MRIGYAAPYNENCEVRDNVIVNGGLDVVRYREVTQEGNLIVRKGEKRPKGTKSVLLANRFDRNRAHLVIYNWDKAEELEVRAKPFLKNGDSYRLMNPQNLFGSPVVQGRCEGDTIRLPAKGEFGIFVILKDE
jgi:hypothetical protein